MLSITYNFEMCKFTHLKKQIAEFRYLKMMNKSVIKPGLTHCQNSGHTNFTLANASGGIGVLLIRLTAALMAAFLCSKVSFSMGRLRGVQQCTPFPNSGTPIHAALPALIGVPAASSKNLLGDFYV